MSRSASASVSFWVGKLLDVSFLQCTTDQSCLLHCPEGFKPNTITRLLCRQTQQGVSEEKHCFIDNTSLLVKGNCDPIRCKLRSFNLSIAHARLDRTSICKIDQYHSHGQICHLQCQPGFSSKPNKKIQVRCTSEGEFTFTNRCTKVRRVSLQNPTVRSRSIALMMDNLCSPTDAQK